MRAMSKRRMQYGSRNLKPGELFEMEGQVNDILMLKSPLYIAPWSGGKGVKCDECKREFASEAYLKTHFVDMHSEAAKARAALPELPADREHFQPATHRCACGNEHAAPLTGGGEAA